MPRTILLPVLLASLLLAPGSARAQEPPAPPPPPPPTEPAPAAAPAPGTPAPGGGWLDATPVANWNQQGAALPKAPAMDGEALSPGRCADQTRPPDSPADRAVIAAGWTLVGPLQVFGETSLVTAAVKADGMCRPLGYQGFVFVRGRFAGTVSPASMDARTDGAAIDVQLLSRDRVMAVFARYTSEDALCCPSRTSRATYSIKRSPGGSTLVVDNVATEAAGPSR